MEEIGVVAIPPLPTQNWSVSQTFGNMWSALTIRRFLMRQKAPFLRREDSDVAKTSGFC